MAGDSFSAADSVFKRADYFEHHIEKLLCSMSEELGCRRENVGSATTMKRGNKDYLVGWLESSLEFMDSQRDVIKELRSEVSQLQKKTIDAQDKLLIAQDQLLEKQSDQLESVKKSVQASVEEGMKTYSSVVGPGSSPAHQAPSQKMLQKAVNAAFAAEDRSHNIMMFGLQEEADVKLEVAVGDVLQELGERPQVEVVRLGSATASKPRPVKVTFRSTAIPDLVLRKCLALKESGKYSRVFITPDRSAEERNERRGLLVKLKEKRASGGKDRHFYISGDEVRSRDVQK